MVRAERSGVRGLPSMAVMAITWSMAGSCTAYAKISRTQQCPK